MTIETISEMRFLITLLMNERSFFTKINLKSFHSERLSPNKRPLCVAKSGLFLFSPLFEMVSNVFDKMIRWDYADAFSLNRGSAQTNVHFALQSLDFFVFSAF